MKRSLNFSISKEAWGAGEVELILRCSYSKSPTQFKEELEHSICLGLVVAARQSHVGSKFPNLKFLIFFAFTSKFYNKSRASFQISSPNTYSSLSVSICKRNEVNWTKNDRVRVVFVDEVKILDFRRGQNSTFWPKF